MHGEIITIGDELITGRVCDLNSFFLSGRVSSYGIEIKAITSVGDDPPRIVEVLNRAVGRSDFVLVSGGLGPTDDDLTTRVAADFFQRPLVLSEYFLERIKKSLLKKGAPWVESYRKMAYIPEGASLIDPDGQACGYYLMHGEIPVIFLPGVPLEVRLLTEAKVLPFLLEFGRGPHVGQRVLKLFGLPEAKIGELLSGLHKPDNGISIGYYPNFPENHVTLTVRRRDESEVAEVLASLEKEVFGLLGDYVVARDEENLETVVGRLLKEKGYTVAVAESCTGGRIAQRLTGVSGSSDYFERGIVSYSNQAKMDLLGVSAETLENHGAVSSQTARQMAGGIRERSGVDIGLASTGIAGPTGGTREKPVGTVYLALATPDGISAELFNFSGDREKITALTAETALGWLRRYLKDDTLVFRH